jgi:hypothetical protein
MTSARWKTSRARWRSIVMNSGVSAHRKIAATAGRSTPAPGKPPALASAGRPTTAIVGAMNAQ